MRPGGETVAKALNSLFGAGAAKKRAPKPSQAGLPATGLPAKTIDAFAKASGASLASVPTAKPAKPGGPDGIRLTGSVMEQTEGFMRRAEILAPRGYRYFPKMGSLEAHWIGPGLLPVFPARY